MADAAHDPGRLTRLALAAIAAAIIAVVAIELHWVRVEAAGRAIAASTRSNPVLLHVAVQDFERARAHDPGTDALFDEAELYVFLGASRLAVAPLRDAIAIEPQNALAWRLLAQAAAGSDPALAAEAEAQALRLNPPVRRPPAR
jgi:tetratricopeptide (TPR) repeat protein